MSSRNSVNAEDPIPRIAERDTDTGAAEAPIVFLQEESPKLSTQCKFFDSRAQFFRTFQERCDEECDAPIEDDPPDERSWQRERTCRRDSHVACTLARHVNGAGAWKDGHFGSYLLCDGREGHGDHDPLALALLADSASTRVTLLMFDPREGDESTTCVTASLPDGGPFTTQEVLRALISKMNEEQSFGRMDVILLASAPDDEEEEADYLEYREDRGLLKREGEVLLTAVIKRMLESQLSSKDGS